MKKKFLFLLLVVLLLLTFSVWMTSIWFIKNKQLSVQKYNLSAIVSSHYGIGFFDYNIFLGKVPPNAQGIRKLQINNNRSVPVRVIVQIYGNISQFINLSFYDTVLQPNETQTLRLAFAPPEGTKYGNYSGELFIITKRI